MCSLEALPCVGKWDITDNAPQSWDTHKALLPFLSCVALDQPQGLSEPESSSVK